MLGNAPVSTDVCEDARLGDLLERVLDRGVIIHADIILSVAGIPLVGISLHSALASIETMISYGMLEDWDAEARAEAAVQAANDEADRLAPGELHILEQYGSYRGARGIKMLWQPGRILLTDRRFVVFRPLPHEVFIDVPLDDVASLGVTHRDAVAEPSDVLCVMRSNGDIAILSAEHPTLLEASVRDRIRRLGRDAGVLDEAVARRYTDPDMRAGSRLRYLSASDNGDGDDAWMSGWAMLDDYSFCWWPDPDGDDGPRGLRTAGVRVPLCDVRDISIDHGRPSACLRVDWGHNGASQAACFAGTTIIEWRDELRVGLDKLIRSSEEEDL